MNNLLLVIQGSLERIERQLTLTSDEGAFRAMRLARHGVERAAARTHQLLAFARRQPLDPKPVDANRLVSGAPTCCGARSAKRLRSKPCWQADCGEHTPIRTSSRARS